MNFFIYETKFSDAVPKGSLELLCKDGTRQPIEQYLDCNWGRVPTDAIVTSSATHFDNRVKYQKFLNIVADRYYTQKNTTYESDRNKPIYDQFGNRIRNKRQSDTNQFNRNDDRFPNRNPDDRFNNQNDPFNGNNQFNRNDFNRNDFNSNDPSNSRDRFNNNDPYNSNNDPFNNSPFNNPNDPYNTRDDQNRFNNRFDQNDPFRQDPYSINREQYGENIDPYVTDTRPTFDRRPDRFNQSNEPLSPRDYNLTEFEVFNIFDSTPRYGIHANLLFQVCILY